MQPCPACNVPHAPGETCAGHEGARRRQEDRAGALDAPTENDALAHAPTLAVEVKAPPVPAGTLLDGRYRLEERIGVGGMGEVYRAIDTRLGKAVAIKRVIGAFAQNPDILARFHAEIRTTVRVDHPNVVDVLDKGQDGDGRPYFVLEFLEGRTLRDELVKSGRMGVSRTLKIADQLLRGLAKAHRRKVLHRDLKPANIILVDDGSETDFVKILDFGIAKALDDAISGEHTRAGYVLGTPAYIAPEVRFGRRSTHPSVDIYAAGVILYEMLAGSSPFTISEQERLAFGGDWHAPPPIRVRFPDLPEGLATVVDKAMAEDPAARFQTAEDLRAALLGLGDLDISGLAPGTIIDDRYRVVRLLGKGGTAVVYLAEETRISRACAIKFLFHEDAGNPTLRNRFFQDAALAARIEHPGIVRIFGSGEWRGQAYIAMEYLDAEPLRLRWSSLDWAGLVDVLVQVAEALDAVHRQGVVHRDVTPENIVVDARGAARLLDFGIARLADSQLTLSTLGYVIGRYGYVSPEQAYDPRTVTSASDQWSLAAIVYEALTGRPPFCEPGDPAEGPEANELICKRLHGKVPPADPREVNPRISGGLAQAVLRALSDDAGARYPSVRDFAAALASSRAPAIKLAVPARANEEIAGSTNPVWHTTVKTGRRRVSLALGFAVAVGASTLAVVLMVGHSRSRAPALATPAVSTPMEIGQPALPPEPEPARTGPVASESPTPAAGRGPDELRMTIDSKPAGGVAILDGKHIPLPTTISGAAGTEVRLRVERRGYKARDVALQFSADRHSQIVELTRDGRRHGARTRPADDERPLYLEPENRVKRPE